MSIKRIKLWVMAAILVLAGGAASAQVTNDYSFNFSVNQNVPDNNQNGLALSADLTGMIGTIANITVFLNITNGFNGDLYAYLAGPNGGFAVLLNRVGVSNSASANGYSDSGFNISFSDSATNSVHFYQSFNYSLNSSGQLIGNWQPDGENINPTSPPTAFTGNQTAMLGSFNATDPNGTWTLFLADLSPGGVSDVVDWGLNIQTVPEPSTTALLAVGAIGVIWAKRRIWTHRSKQSFDV